MKIRPKICNLLTLSLKSTKLATVTITYPKLCKGKAIDNFIVLKAKNQNAILKI